MLSHTSPSLKRSSLAQANGDGPRGHRYGFQPRDESFSAFCDAGASVQAEGDAVVTLVLPDSRPMATAARASES